MDINVSYEIKQFCYEPSRVMDIILMPIMLRCKFVAFKLI